MSPSQDAELAQHDSRPSPLAEFVRRRAAVLLIGLLVLFLGLLLWYAVHVLLILFAGLLFGLFLMALTDFVARWTRLPRGVALAAVVLALLGLLVGVGWLVGPRVAGQATELADRLPRAVHDIYDRLQTVPAFRWAAAHFSSVTAMIPGSGLTGRVTGYVYNVVDFFVEFVIVLFFGLFLATQPRLYADALVLLVPLGKRPRARQILGQTGHALRWWLLGRIVSMTIIGVFDGVGLWLLGVPIPLTLGIIAGLFTFVPNFGPIASAIPAVLVAFTLPGHPWLPLWVVVLKVGVQAVESYLVTPLVQQRAIQMPPAMTLGMQFLLGTLTGLPGLALAVPLTAAGVVITRMAYVEDALGDRGTRPEPKGGGG
jgi:predicted PurR-regulated permease PerM